MKETNFKQTELGPIPHDWEVVPLGDYAENYTGLTYTPSDVSNYGTLVLRSSNIQEGKLSFEDNVFVSCQIPERAKTHKGDVLICVRNGSARLVGKSALILSDSLMAFGAFMTVLRCKENLSYTYLNYYWQSESLQSQINDNKGNIINQITSYDIHRYKLIFPPLAEQRAIGKALSDVDELIDGLKKLIEKKRAIKHGAMSDLLSGKRRLPGFNKPWARFKLSNLAYYANVVLPVDTFEDTDYICTENMLSNCKGVAPYCDVVLAFYVKSYVPFDILLSNIRPYLKKIWLADRSGGVSNDVLVIRPNHELVNSQLLYYILSRDDFFDYNMEGVSGTKMPRGNKIHIMKYEFSVPSDISEQAAIAAVLTDMDNEIETLEKKLSKYQQIKQGMMSQLLTGKIRLI